MNTKHIIQGEILHTVKREKDYGFAIFLFILMTLFGVGFSLLIYDLNSDNSIVNSIVKGIVMSLAFLTPHMMACKFYRAQTVTKVYHVVDGEMID